MHKAVRLTCCSAMLAMSGCAPIITHGPEVHPGFSGGMSFALGNGPTYENGDDPGPFYSGVAATNIAYGFRPAANTRPAFRVGLQGPTGEAVAVDLFVQAPRQWMKKMAAGVGVLAEFADGRQMPYLQAGVTKDGFGINGVVGAYWNRNRRTGYTLQERAQVNWVNFQAPLARWASLHIHAGYAFGHVKKTIDRDNTPYVDENRWVRLAGATLEFHR